MNKLSTFKFQIRCEIPLISAGAASAVARKRAMTGQAKVFVEAYIGVRRRRKPAENAAQLEKERFMDVNALCLGNS